MGCGPSVTQQLPFGVMGPGFRRDDKEFVVRFLIQVRCRRPALEPGDDADVPYSSVNPTRNVTW